MIVSIQKNVSLATENLKTKTLCLGDGENLLKLSSNKVAKTKMGKVFHEACTVHLYIHTSGILRPLCSNLRCTKTRIICRWKLVVMFIFCLVN